MADAAVEFLLENLKQLLLNQAHLIKDAKNQFEKLQRDLRFLKAQLMDSTKSRRKNETLKALIQEIRDAVYEAEDIIDTYVTQAAADKAKPKPLSFILKSFHRSGLTERVEPLCRKIKEILDERKGIDLGLLSIEDGQLEPPILRKHNVVGFEDEARTLKGYLLTEETEQLDVISIIGMPGLGKTTLAGKIFHDPEIQYQFPIRIWIYVSQDFTKKDIFLSILKEFTNMDMKGKSNQELADLVSQNLMNVKFLLVTDDVWTTGDWDKIKIALPKTNRGKVLITSRQVEVGNYASGVRKPHMLRLLDRDESWLLLRYEVFGKPEFPTELEEEGKLIAKRCGGLPLAVVVIGGILVKKFSASGETSSMKKAWREVSESFVEHINDDIERRMEKIIALSYEILPFHLKECFLYVGMFPEDFEIPAWKLIRMWIAEGLIQPRDNDSSEKTAEKYLDDLINRNLIRADKFKADGKVKSCRIHDLLRDFCITQAGNERENFFQEVKVSGNGGFCPSQRDKCRRLCIHSNILNFLSEKPLFPKVRSFVCFSKDEIPIQSEHISAIPAGFKLLRVLDVKPIKFTKLHTDMYRLLLLRYINITLSSCQKKKKNITLSNSSVLPSAFSKLWNLQTLIVDTSSPTLEVKVDILNMIQLSHFKTNASASLPKTSKSSKGGEKIQTLGTISPQSCTEDVFNRARNMKKLGIRGRLALIVEDKEGSFDSIGKLAHLEKLKLINDQFLCETSELQLRRLPPAYKFPPQLRSLTLCNTSLDWSQMYILETLDKLEVLKLKDKAFWGETWVTTSGFPCLEVLHIERTNLVTWYAYEHQFPRLKRLELRNCENLNEVPMELAKIPNFQLLDLHRSTLAASSAKKRKMEDEQLGSVRRFKLSIFPPEE